MSKFLPSFIGTSPLAVVAAALPSALRFERDRQAPAPHPLIEVARLEPAAAIAHLGVDGEGLDPGEVAARRAEYGPNALAEERRRPFLVEIARRCFTHPLNVLLGVLAVVSWLGDDAMGALIMLAMVFMSVFLSYFQETRTSRAIERLRSLVSNTATVRRRPAAGADGVRVPAAKVEVAIDQLVPGDVVHLAAGHMIPADLRLVAAKDLFVNQSSLTGESMPVEKFAAADRDATAPLEARNLCFMGSNVVSGSALGVIVATGARTTFGALAGSIAGERAQTSFDRGVQRFAWLMIRFMAVMVPFVFLVNGFAKGAWLDAFMFAVAVSVGLAPEMLPMIVTINLAKGAMEMAKKDVVVKRLGAIQNFGAIDVLCTDKTGTLTQDRVILERHVDVHGGEDERVLEFAFLNSHHQTGLRNLLDVAVIERVDADARRRLLGEYTLVDEVPFDFTRRRMSVIVRDRAGRHFLVAKGAVAEMLGICARVRVASGDVAADEACLADARRVARDMNDDGFRVIALGMREIEAKATYSLADETGLVLTGFVAFLDPPKDSAADAIRALADHGVAVKVLTGDNDIVTRNVCRQVGLRVERWLVGPEVAAMGDEELAIATRDTQVFARLDPAQKVRVIEALHRDGRVVGFMGDGINDGPALRAADVGISVDSAVDIAKEAADIILLEKSLMVLEEGLLEGRKVFGNILKYIKMTASSNFGNMFSVLGASAFLPFLPMAAVQILLNNLLYDLSQTSVATDDVDPEYLARPRQWDMRAITRFVLCIGPVSSLFDYATFALLWFVFGANEPGRAGLFQTGWFVESLLSQTLVVHVIRTGRLPFVRSRASRALTATGVVICLIGAMLPYSPLAPKFGFVALPATYWLYLALILAAYMALAQVVKTALIRRFGLL
ncbi:magnesium-translocating P-type ATPase [Dokdonella fugitiva]|uniref:magnesium-translocating P-type ATPase n=1 Tax=Dokdonella fugitiva TaxID=328517 RepID=UPI0015FA9101|nr:magnesium-translocating P-type ATPase [Dokdonella fugitiva]MBA8883044.1 Mg2+-importing ATPase [Dokdonella fugitiva]